VSSVLGDLNTKAEGFAGGGVTSASRKRYTRSVMAALVMWQKRTLPAITFTNDDRKDVIPYEDDLVVVSIIAMGRRIHRVLVDQGSSADVMFWDAFTRLGIPQDQLRPLIKSWLA